MIQSRPNQPLPDEPTFAGPGQEPTDRLKQHGDEVKRTAQDVKARAGEAAADAGQRLKDVGRQAKDQAAALAGQATQEARSRADQLAVAGTNKLAEQAHVFGDAFYRAADRLEEEGGADQKIGQYARSLGDCCESVASYLRDADSRRLLAEARTFTRRHPEVVLGGLFLAGLAAARFLKASDRRDRDIEFESGDLGGPGLGYAGGYGAGGYVPTDYAAGYETDLDAGYGVADMDAGLDMDLDRDLDAQFDDDLASDDLSDGGLADVRGDADLRGSTGDMILDEGVTSGLAPMSREDRGQTGAPALSGEEPSYTRNPDLTSSIAPQPGSSPPLTPGGSLLSSTEPTSGSLSDSASCPTGAGTSASDVLPAETDPLDQSDDTFKKPR